MTGGEIWIDEELAGSRFRDARLGQRLRTLMTQLAGAVGSPIPLACQDWANTKAAYRFLSNPDVSASEINGETLARVARRYDVLRSQIYNWRHQFRKNGLLPAPVGPIFLPIDIGAPMLNAEPALEERMVSPLIVELCLAQGRCLRFDSGIEAAALTRLIKSVEAA